MKLTALEHGQYLNVPITSQNTMYCGGEPEHKRVANKCMREEIHAHNNDELY